MQHDAPFDISEANREGDLFGFVLPAGQYEIFYCELSRDNAVFAAEEFEAGKFIGFKVVEGAVLYLGNIHFSDDNMRHVVRLQDFLERDASLFKARYPNVDRSAASINPKRGR